MIYNQCKMDINLDIYGHGTQKKYISQDGKIIFQSILEKYQSQHYSKKELYRQLVDIFDFF